MNPINQATSSLRTGLDQPLISIIIVTYNSSEVILSCLESVCSQFKRRVEVIVVDNASKDSTADIVRQKFPEVNLIENKQNLGFAAGVDSGAGKAHGEFLLLLNPDSTLRDGFFDNLLQYIDRTPQASIIGARLTDDHGRDQPSCWETPGLKTLTFEALLPYSLSLSLLARSPESTREVDMVSGACMAVKREVFDRLGGLDRHFFMYYEDADFCLRAVRAGYHVYFCHEISATHRLRKSPGSYSSSFFQNLYLSKILFFRKNYSRSFYVVAWLFMVAGILLRIPAYFLAGVLLFNKQLLRLSKYHTFVLRNILNPEASKRSRRSGGSTRFKA